MTKSIINEIAKKMGYTYAFVFMIMKKQRYTIDFSLAECIAKETKESPLNYISPKLKQYYKEIKNKRN
jgi:hypothetical protein